MPEPRRFPPPCTVEELDACFVVKDSAGYEDGEIVAGLLLREQN